MRHVGGVGAFAGETGSVDDANQQLASDVPAQALGALMGGLVGLAVAGPAGGLVGTAATPYLVGVAERALSELRASNQQRALRVLAVASEETCLEPEELEGRLLGSERTLLLAGTAIEAAMRTVNEAKIRALGRALAAGLIANDDAAIDEEQLIISALADMEAPHVSMLDLIVNYMPNAWVGGFEAQRYEPKDYPGVPGARDPGFHPGRRMWTAAHIGRARPHLTPVLSGLLGTLQRHGLIAQADMLPEALEKFSKEQDRASAQAIRGGGGGTLVASQLRNLSPPATWVPTEMGVHVLTYLGDSAGEVPPSAS